MAGILRQRFLRNMNNEKGSEFSEPFSLKNQSYFFFLLIVFIPNGRYKGQKLMRLVNINTNPMISKINPNVPVRMFVK